MGTVEFLSDELRSLVDCPVFVRGYGIVYFLFARTSSAHIFVESNSPIFTAHYSTNDAEAKSFGVFITCPSSVYSRTNATSDWISPNNPLLPKLLGRCVYFLSPQQIKREADYMAACAFLLESRTL